MSEQQDAGRVTAHAVLSQLFAGGVSQVGDGGHLTGMRKRAVVGPVAVSAEGVRGDDIVDRRFHGGPERALNVFAQEYYAHLKQVFPQPDEPWLPGGFGENLSTVGLLDHELRLGDTFRVGTVVIQLSQPRSPCWKLNARFGVPQLSRHVQDQRMTGWYARVLEPGLMEAGDSIELLDRDESAPTLAGFWDLVLARDPDPDRLAALAGLDALAAEWQEKLAKRAQYLKRKA